MAGGASKRGGKKAGASEDTGAPPASAHKPSAHKRKSSTMLDELLDDTHFTATQDEARGVHFVADLLFVALRLRAASLAARCAALCSPLR
jgi:hypothetical protein